jgi:hypothetical protein
MRQMKFRKFSCVMMVTLLMLGITSPLLALTIDSQFDGQWNETGAGARRGWNVQYLEQGPEQGVVFLVGFVYDDAGNPFWVNGAGSVVPGQFQVTIPLELVEGGAFGPEIGSPATTDPNWGTMEITFDDCNNAEFAWTSPNVGDGSLDLSPVLYVVNTEGSTTDRCVYQKPFTACPAFATAGAAPRTCILSGTYTEDITLTNDTTWVLSGGVFIGAKDATDNSNTLNIEAGTRIIGSGGVDLLVISRGAKIVAEGQPYAPIVFSGPKTVSEGADAGDFGGLVINGFAPLNTCDAQPCTAVGEGDSGTFGGDDPHDSSGVLRYVRVQFGGVRFTDTNELNGLAFQGVGNGTVIDYLQIHAGADDGVEFFGGTVNVKHLIITNAEDDSIDWTQGYSGNIQHVIVKQAEDQATDTDQGFELDNLEQNNDATPRAQPKLANLTVIGRAGELGMVLRRGTGGNFSNMILTNFDRCINIDSSATFAAAGTPPDNLTGVLTMENTLVDCQTNFVVDAADPWTTASWFAGQSGNAEQDPQLDGIYPPADADYLSGNNLDPAVFGEFFDFVDWIGAVRNADSAWHHKWSIFVDE